MKPYSAFFFILADKIKSMNKFIVTTIIICTCTGISKAQTKKPVAKSTVKHNSTTVADNPLKTMKDTASYALGLSIGQSLQSQNLSKINTSLLMKGLTDVLQNKKAGFSDQEVANIINQYVEKMSAEKAKANKEAGRKFLEANAKRKTVVTLPDGLQYEVIKTGNDTTKPKLTDKVKCHYQGTLIDGTVFDSSVDRGEPVTFPVNGVIKGWQEALQLMTAGSKWKIYLPSSLGYGDHAAGPKIGPGSALIFEVELLGIEK